MRFSALVRVWNITGQPAISLPLGRTADGVPVGVQLVGAPFRDDLVLAVAAQLEAAVGWPPPAQPDAALMPTSTRARVAAPRSTVWCSRSTGPADPPVVQAVARTAAVITTPVPNRIELSPPW